jgi:hypothetical protein
VSSTGILACVGFRVVGLLCARHRPS